MANILYLGSTPLIDLSAYATESYVDAAVANVDVTDQLSNYVLKDGDKVLSSNDFTDSLKTKLEGLSNFDPTDINTAIAAIQGTLADITLDGSVNTVIDTWTEIKNFLADYSTANDLKDIIDAVESTVKTWVGNQGYLTSNDVSTFVTQDDIDNSLQDASTAIGVLDTSVNAIEADYVKSNDISTFITDNDASVYAQKSEIPTVPTTVSSFTNDSGYQTANDVSTKVASANQSVMNIVSISQADYTALATKDASTLYIVL